MIITPWKVLAGATGYTPTAANFPALKHFFRCDEVGGNHLSDEVGNVVIGDPDDLVVARNSTYSQCAKIDNSVTSLTIQSGTVVTPGTKSIIGVCVGVPASTLSSVVIGSTTAASNQGIRLSAVASRAAAALNGGSTAAGSDGATGNGAPLAIATQLAIVPSSTSTMHHVGYDGTTFTAYTDKTIASTPAGGMVAIEQVFTVAYNTAPGLIFVLHPTTAFTNAEMQAIVAWAYWAVFTANGGAGNKNAAIAPWLRGRT